MLPMFASIKKIVSLLKFFYNMQKLLLSECPAVLVK